MLAPLYHLRRALISAGLLIMLTISSLYQALVTDLPDTGDLPTCAMPTKTEGYDCQNPPHASASLSLDEIPVYLRQAAVAVKDATFYDNSNAGPNFRNGQVGEIVSGGSPLTQQVARLILPSHDGRGGLTLAHRLREALLARRLARTWARDAILETYLNHACYGKTAYGVEAAAGVYFGVHARDLNLAQCALLAGLPQAPVDFDPLINPETAKARQKAVLQAMVDQGYISQFEADLAYAEPLRFAEHLDLSSP
jgi:membrane peptidoglycan carboxypeptidase